MNEHLPIPVRPTVALRKLSQKQGLYLRKSQLLHIRSVFYAGDEVGILCDITPPGREKMPVVCSLTHLEIQDDSPLENDMRLYQQLRSKRLAR